MKANVFLNPRQRITRCSCKWTMVVNIKPGQLHVDQGEST